MDLEDDMMEKNIYKNCEHKPHLLIPSEATVMRKKPVRFGPHEENTEKISKSIFRCCIILQSSKWHVFSFYLDL